MKHSARRILLLSALLALLLLLGAVSVYGADSVIWGNPRNSAENNAVTDRPASDYDNVFLRWGRKYGENGSGMDFSNMPTPPLIIGDYLYTQIASNVYKIDKATGEVAAMSGNLAAKSDYALNSMTYGGGKLFVALSNGMIQAVDADTLEVLWHTPRISGQQMNCPLTYHEIGGKGYVYTGSWEGDTRDGSYYCYAADDTVDAYGFKQPVWTFTPSKDDPSLAGSDSAARGFYWAGAYVTDRYVAVGSDDGAGTVSFSADRSGSSSFYTLDPLTGEIIDQTDDLCGDLRCTPVFYENKLYVASKGGVLYQIPVSSDGTLGTAASYDFNEGAGAGSTNLRGASSPTIFNDRLYMGVSSSGGSFVTTGHTLAVLDVSGKLSQSSMIYESSVPGNPQAAPLVSTAKFDNSGDVYVYFTYNCAPGGIYYLVDNEKCMSAPKKSGDFFVPETSMQQYCTCSLAMDLDGSIYYKNDSTALMAISPNRARINDLSVSCDVGTVIQDKPFASGMANYQYSVDSNATRATITLNLPDEVTAKINETPYRSGGVQVVLNEEDTTVTVTASHGTSDTRVYTLRFVRQSNDSSLAGLTISNGGSNSQPGAKLVNWTDNYDVTTDTHMISTDYIETINTTSKFLNLWLSPASSTSTIKVYPDTNVKAKNLDADGAIMPQSTGTYDSLTYSRYPVYPEDTTRNATVNVEVTAENGTTITTYHIDLMLYMTLTEVNLEPAELALAAGETATLKAVIAPANASNQTVVFSSSDPTIARVDASTGKVTAVSSGAAEITVLTEDGHKTAKSRITVTAEDIPDETAEARAARFAGYVDAAIAALPPADELTPLHQTVVNSVRAAYDRLSADAKAHVTRLATLEAAEAAIELAQYKEEKLADLKGSIDTTLYYSSELQTIKTILAICEDTVADAATKAKVDKAIAHAVSEIEKVPTKAVDEKEIEKQKAAFAKKKVESVTATANATGKRLKVKWTKVAKADFYEITWKVNEAGAWKSATSDKLTYTIKGLKKNPGIRVQVRPVRILAAGTPRSVDAPGTWSGNYKFLAHKGVFVSLKKAPRAFTATWKPIKTATGYQVCYAPKKDFKLAVTKTKNGAKNKSLKIVNRPSNTTYFVKVRTYKKIKGQVYYGNWSAVKKVKTQ